MKRLSILALTMALLVAAVFHVLRDTDAAKPAAESQMPASVKTGSSAAALAKLPAGGPSTTASPDAPRHPDGQTPAWLLPASPTVPASSTNLPTTASPGNADPKIARLNAVLEKLNQLQMQPDIDAKAAAAAIAELEQINGSSVMNGVRFDVLRENLLMSDQIATASKELQALQHAETAETAEKANTPERAALLQSKIANLAALRSRIRFDVMQPPAARVSP